MFRKMADRMPTFDNRRVVLYFAFFAFMLGWSAGDDDWFSGGLSAAMLVIVFACDRIAVARQKINKVEIELENEFVIDIRNRDAIRTPAYPTRVTGQDRP